MRERETLPLSLSLAPSLLAQLCAHLHSGLSQFSCFLSPQLESARHTRSKNERAGDFANWCTYFHLHHWIQISLLNCYCVQVKGLFLNKLTFAWMQCNASERLIFTEFYLKLCKNLPLCSRTILWGENETCLLLSHLISFSLFPFAYSSPLERLKRNEEQVIYFWWQVASENK